MYSLTSLPDIVFDSTSEDGEKELLRGLGFLRFLKTGVEEEEEEDDD